MDGFEHGPHPEGMLLWAALSSIAWFGALAVPLFFLLRRYGWRLLGALGARPMAQIEPREPAALEVLRLRYVRGEISAEMFEEMVHRVLASEAPHSYRGAPQTGVLPNQAPEGVARDVL